MSIEIVLYQGCQHDLVQRERVSRSHLVDVSCEMCARSDCARSSGTGDDATGGVGRQGVAWGFYFLKKN